MAKQIEVVLGALEAGHTTSAAIAKATGLSVVTAAARLYDLELTGLIERAAVVPRDRDVTRGGSGSISWRVKGKRGW